MRYYKDLKKIKIHNTNCLFFAIWYRIYKGGKFCAEFDTKLCFWHFYNTKSFYEIHLEQENRKTERWKPLLTGHIKIYYKY
jgi:hypothetical protein